MRLVIVTLCLIAAFTAHVAKAWATSLPRSTAT